MIQSICSSANYYDKNLFIKLKTIRIKTEKISIFKIKWF